MLSRFKYNCSCSEVNPEGGEGRFLVNELHWGRGWTVCYSNGGPKSWLQRRFERTAALISKNSEDPVTESEQEAALHAAAVPERNDLGLLRGLLTNSSRFEVRSSEYKFEIIGAFLFWICRILLVFYRTENVVLKVCFTWASVYFKRQLGRCGCVLNWYTELSSGFLLYVKYSRNILKLACFFSCKLDEKNRWYLSF